MAEPRPDNQTGPDGQAAEPPLGLNDLLRLLAKEGRLPLPLALQLAPVLVRAGLTTRPAIAADGAAGLAARLPGLAEPQAARIVSACAPARKRKRGPAAPSTAKRGRRYDAGGDPSDEPLPLETDLAVVRRARAYATNRSPLMILFALAVLEQQYPELPVSSHLSLAQAAATRLARAKAATIGLAAPLAEPAGASGSLTVMGIRVDTIRRGTDAAAGVWGLDPEHDGDGLAWAEPEPVRRYLLRVFGEHGLGVMRGAIRHVVESWAAEPSWETRAWGWYCTVRPAVQPGREGWGQKGSVDPKTILALARAGGGGGQAAAGEDGGAEAAAAAEAPAEAAEQTAAAAAADGGPVEPAAGTGEPHDARRDP
ncbi:uncharacterized protein V1510DRAFT_367635 [Dipodascopsis tothii]|uniref:uncharacterized protein n=1 Tax=Dipodascopsis tothii TaxID=44089 RepID=UPI0034CEBB60